MWSTPEITVPWPSRSTTHYNRIPMITSTDNKLKIIRCLYHLLVFTTFLKRVRFIMENEFKVIGCHITFYFYSKVTVIDNMFCFCII